MLNHTIKYALAGALGILTALPGGVLAADHHSAAATLKEVIVTATKRATNEQTTPASLTAFNAKNLYHEQITSIKDLALYTPGLFVGSDNGFGAVTTAIRGFGPLNLSIGGEEAVGVYIDGVYQGTPFANDFNFIDVNRVEVLRGPQGTLYGRNATGGAILISTLTPGRKKIVRADIGMGQLNSYEGRALVSGPITKTLSGEIAIGKESRDGWSYNPILGQKLNGQSNFNSSAALHWTPAGIWDFLLNIRYGTEKDTLVSKNANDGLPIDVIPAEFPNAGYRSFSAGTFRATGKLPWAKLINIVGWTNVDRHSMTSSGNVGLTQFLELTKASEWYEESRLVSTTHGRFSWIVGVTGFQQHASDVVNFTLTPKLLGTSPGLGIVFDNGLVTTSYAGYIQLGWQLTRRIHITVGDRYTRDRKTWSNCVTFGQYTDLVTNGYSPVYCNTPFNTEVRTWTATTPKGIIDFKLNNDVFTYFSVNKGFRDGGWNLTEAVNPATPYSTAFNPEYGTSYEVGLKSEFWNHRVRANIDAYRASYTNLQVRTIDPVYHLFGVHNAGSAVTKGVELELLARPVPRLLVGANVAWERAQYRNFSYISAGTKVNYAGNYLDNAPQWMGNVTMQYRIPWRRHGTLTPRVNVSYQSRVYYTEANVAPYDGPAHETVDVQLRYDAASAPWGWDIYVNNVTNDQWREYAYQGELNVVGADYALPRIAGIRLFWNE